MFKQLMPILRHRAVLLTASHVNGDQIRVNLVPKKTAESENDALTTPMSFTGTAEELDAQFSEAMVSFVASHLELKNTLARAKEEVDAAAKAAQEEARNKAKNLKKPSTQPVKKVEPEMKEESKKEPEPPRRVSLFDAPAPVKASEIETTEEDESSQRFARTTTQRTLRDRRSSTAKQARQQSGEER